MGVDPTRAPLGDVSIGAAIEAYTGANSVEWHVDGRIGITTAVKAVPVKPIGYSGLLVPVMADKLPAQRWAEGSYHVNDQLTYFAVCGTGLDTLPLPGDVNVERMGRILGDVAALAWKWKKPLSARLQPVWGEKAGDKPSSEASLIQRDLASNALQRAFSSLARDEAKLAVNRQYWLEVERPTEIENTVGKIITAINELRTLSIATCALGCKTAPYEPTRPCETNTDGASTTERVVPCCPCCDPRLWGCQTRLHQMHIHQIT